MRDFIVLSILSSILILLGACGSAEDATEYVDVSFSGVDTMGIASYDLDEDALIEDVFDLDEDLDFPDQETISEIEKMLDAYKIKLENDEDLSNGDTVKLIVNVDEEKTDKIKGGEKEFTVEDLEEPEVLTSEDVEENLVLNFNGVSGKGTAQIDNVFDDSFLRDFSFDVKDDGELENGEEAEIIVEKDSEDALHSNGYLLDEDFRPTFKVEGLDVVAEKATDIENLKDIERLMEEELNEKYKDTDFSFGSNTEYEMEQEALMYRQFNKEDEENLHNSGNNHGNLVGIYSMKKYKIDDDDKKLDDEYIVAYGFSDIILDEDNKANISDLETIGEERDDSYSLESVIQIYEGNDYEKVDK